MVRFFKNPYDDYKGEPLVVDKTEILNDINEHISHITKSFKPSKKHVNGGLYVGVTGVAFMFYRISQNLLLSEYRSVYLDKCLEYLKPALGTSTGDKSSFLLGDAGTYALATAFNKKLGNDDYIDNLKQYKALYERYLNPKFLKCGGDEFFVGRTGYLAGALWLSRELQTEVFSPRELHDICDVIVASGREYAVTHNSPCPLMYHYYNTEYLGAAHGVSFILQMLLTVPGYLKSSVSAANDIKATVAFIASLQTDEGNWPCCLDEIMLSEHKLVHWCHGAPGTVYLMAKAYLVYEEQKYYDACIKAGELVWQKGLLRKGPGICHGVAGNGYVFLLLYRLTKNEKYLYRAKAFADFMKTDEFEREARLPDNAQSLYEGVAGTVCYLADMLVPETAEYPFEIVF